VADFFRKLFGIKATDQPAAQKQVDMATTAPLSDQQISAIISNQAVKYEMRQLIASVGQSVGKQREHNEDILLAITSTISGSVDSIPFGLYIVADGMGGHQFGEVASNAAVRIMGGNIIKKFFPYLFNLPTEALQDSLQEMMETSIMEAHQYVQREAPGSGTTVTAALILGQQVTIAHVGDSRAYSVYPDGRIEPITRDHSLVKRLEELGHLSKDEAVNFPHRNVLIRALGQGESLEADALGAPGRRGKPGGRLAERQAALRRCDRAVCFVAAHAAPLFSGHQAREAPHRLQTAAILVEQLEEQRAARGSFKADRSISA